MELGGSLCFSLNVTFEGNIYAFCKCVFLYFVINCVKLGRHGTQDKFQSDLTIKYYLILSYLMYCNLSYDAYFEGYDKT